jgi:hypothetical protein
VRRLGKRRAAIAAALAVAGVMMVAPAADAAVVTQTPLVGYQPNNTVRDMIVVGNTAYIGGTFTALTPGGGTAVTRNHVAAINMTTGALLPWNPNVNGTVYSILPAGNNVYLGGSFTTVGGATHKNIAMVNNTDGAVVSTFANTSRPNHAVRAMVVANGNLYVGGAFPTPRSYLMEVNATTNAYIPPWQPVVDAEVRALATDTSQTRIVEGASSSVPPDPAATAASASAP